MNTLMMKYKAITGLLLVAMACCMMYSCESIKDNLDDCGIWLEFIYDHNMEYTDTFDPAVPSVDVFVFDADGKYLFTKTALRTELEGGKRLFLGNDMPLGKYRILTVGGLSPHFIVKDSHGAELIAGQTTIDDVRTSLVRSSTTISNEFPPLWVSPPIYIEYRADLSTWPVNLLKYTNRFNIVMIDASAGPSQPAPTKAPYTFEIITPEGAVYLPGHQPGSTEKVTYTPYVLNPGKEADELCRATLNTVRLIEGNNYPYRIVIRNTADGSVFWDNDLIELLRKVKPSRPDGSDLPMQEYLDRESEWDLILSKGGSYISVGIRVYDWITWIYNIGLKN